MNVTIWSVTRRSTRAHIELAAARKAITSAQHLHLIEEFERGFDYRVTGDRQVPIGSTPVSARIRASEPAAEDLLRWTLRIDLGFMIFLLIWTLMLIALPVLVVRAAFLPIEQPSAVERGFSYVFGSLIYGPLVLALWFFCHRIRLDVRSLHWPLAVAEGIARSEPLRDFHRELRTAKAVGLTAMSLMTLATFVFPLALVVLGRGAAGIVFSCGLSFVFIIVMIIIVVHERRRR